MYPTEPRLSPQVRPRTPRRRWKKTPSPTDPSGVWGVAAACGLLGGSFGAAPRSALNKGAGPGAAGAQLLLGAWSGDKGAWSWPGGAVLRGWGRGQTLCGNPARASREAGPFSAVAPPLVHSRLLKNYWFSPL